MAQASLIGGGGAVMLGDYGIGSRRHHVVYFPESFNFKKSQHFAEIAVPGLNHPIMQYLNGGAAKFTADILLYGYDDNPPMPVDNEINMLKGWCLTTNFGTESLPGVLPPQVNVYFGQSLFFPVAYLTDLDVKVTMVTEDLLPIEAEVRVEFTEYVEVNG